MHPITRTQALPDLLQRTAAARAAFAARRQLGVPPAYQVVPAGRGFFHVIETATGRIHGFRREHLAACALAAELERRSVVTTKKHERREGSGSASAPDQC